MRRTLRGAIEALKASPLREGTEDYEAGWLDALETALADPEPIANETESGYARRRELVDRARALEELVAAMPWKRWTIVLTGDWENGWVAEAMSWAFGGPVEAWPKRRWMDTESGEPTPEAALAKLREQMGS